MKWLKKAFKLSNPVGQALYAYEKITGKEGPSVKINGQESSIDGNVLDAKSATDAFETGRQTIAENKDLSKDNKADAQALSNFKSQDLLNTDADIFTPAFRRNGPAAKEQETMLSLFNSRKDQVLSARRTPGINQTRF